MFLALLGCLLAGRLLAGVCRSGLAAPVFSLGWPGVRASPWFPLIPKVLRVDPAGTGGDPGIVRQKQTLRLGHHDLYMYGQACIVTLCGGAAPRGAPVRAMDAKHAVPPSASG
jgi:hypothetical protein